MNDPMRISCYYDLPVPIAVAHEVLGTVVLTRIGGIRTQVHAPRPMPHRIDSPALAPKLPHIPEEGQDNYWNPYNWAMTFAANYTIEPATSLRRLGVVFMEPTDPLPARSEDHGDPNARIANAAREDLDRWIDDVRTWIEVVTGQDLDHHHPRYDLEFPGDGLHRWDGVWLSKEIRSTRSSTLMPVTRVQWDRVMKLAGDGVEPHLEHLLARDARASLRREDLRRAAIDAGTAVEVVLNEMYRSNIPIIESAGRELAQDRRHLNSLQDLFAELDIAVGVSYDSLSGVIRARNKAAHEAAETGALEMAEVLDTMKSIIDQHGRAHDL